MRLRAYVEAYRTLPTLGPDAAIGDWLAGLVRAEDGDAAEPDDLWAALDEALASESPALAPPELPERRFPVIPRLQRRRRLQGPR